MHAMKLISKSAFHKQGTSHFGGSSRFGRHRQVLQKCHRFLYDSAHSLGWLSLLLLGIMTMDWALDWALDWDLSSLKGRGLDPNCPLHKGTQDRGFRRAEMSLNFSTFPFSSKINPTQITSESSLCFCSPKGENKVVGQGSQRFGGSTVNLFGAYFIKGEAQKFKLISQTLRINLHSRGEGLHL